MPTYDISIDYARYYASLEAQQSESSSAAGLSVPNAGSQRAYSSAASSPALGSISSPLPRLAVTADNDESGSSSDEGRNYAGPVSNTGRKRPREDDDFADPDEGAPWR